MTKVELLIEQLSENALDNSYIRRIDSIRSSVNEDLIKVLFDAGIGQFDESWDTFENSADWDNSWDQG
ncbi:MAG: hypothetical protein V4541_10220 [Bacteroidota bacterium]